MKHIHLLLALFIFILGACSPSHKHIAAAVKESIMKDVPASWAGSKLITGYSSLG